VKKMPIRYIPFIYTAIFALILIATVPKMEIRRLSIYGILFGAVADILVVGFAVITGSFSYINYEPFGLMGIHFFAPISWAIFYIIYFYFLPERKSYMYIYVTLAIFFSMLFCQMLTKLGVLRLAHGMYDSTIPFIIWFPTVTWAYLRLIKKDF